MAALGEHGRDRLRGGSIGYIFQTFNLLQGYSCLENVMLGMTFGARADRGQALALLGRVGLSHRLEPLPAAALLGPAAARGRRPRAGEAARSSCWRTSRPATSTARNAREALRLVRETCLETGAALLLVSHDPRFSAASQNVRDFAELNLALKGAAP